MNFLQKSFHNDDVNYEVNYEIPLNIIRSLNHVVKACEIFEYHHFQEQALPHFAW